MTEISQLNPLMYELLEYESDVATGKFTKRGLEIVDEIADYAEQTEIWKENEEEKKNFDEWDAKKVFAYLLDRINNAPTMVHTQFSVILLMPILREKLRKEQQQCQNTLSARKPSNGLWRLSTWVKTASRQKPL